MLTRIETSCEQRGYRQLALQATALRALALRAQGNLSEALAALERALTFSQPEGHIRVFVDQGELLRQLLAQTAQDRAQNDSIRANAERLLSAFSSEQRREAAGESDTPRVLRSPLERSNALVEPLTERELQVLRLIAAGALNQAIADKLVITIRTVKKHAGIIFDKLGVTSRTEAMTRARELSII